MNLSLTDGRPITKRFRYRSHTDRRRCDRLHIHLHRQSRSEELEACEGEDRREDPLSSLTGPDLTGDWRSRDLP